MLEARLENPRVVSSILTLDTTIKRLDPLITERRAGTVGGVPSLVPATMVPLLESELMVPAKTEEVSAAAPDQRTTVGRCNLAEIDKPGRPS